MYGRNMHNVIQCNAPIRYMPINNRHEKILLYCAVLCIFSVFIELSFGIFVMLGVEAT